MLVSCFTAFIVYFFSDEVHNNSIKFAFSNFDLPVNFALLSLFISNLYFAIHFHFEASNVHREARLVEYLQTAENRVTSAVRDIRETREQLNDRFNDLRLISSRMNDFENKAESADTAKEVRELLKHYDSSNRTKPISIEPLGFKESLGQLKKAKQWALWHNKIRNSWLNFWFPLVTSLFTWVFLILPDIFLCDHAMKRLMTKFFAAS